MPPGARTLLAGRAEVNRVPARYALFGDAGDGGACAERARRAGWRPLRVPSATGGGVRVRAFARGSERLLLAWPAGGPGRVALARFAGALPELPPAGDAPGREPAGVPRPPGSRRLLHVAGDGFEAAWYRAAASPRELARRSAARLVAAGWRVASPGATALVAARAGGRPVTLVTEADGDGAAAFVLAAAE